MPFFRERQIGFPNLIKARFGQGELICQNAKELDPLGPPEGLRLGVVGTDEERNPCSANWFENFDIRSRHAERQHEIGLKGQNPLEIKL